MASVVLGFAGQAVGGLLGGPIGAQIGGMIGSALGGMLDNQLFPQKMEGPRLGDLTVTASTYGQPITLIFGPENRVTGNMIWSTGLIEHVSKSKQGGKGGPSVEVTEYSYTASLAVALGEGVMHSIRKVWANSKVIFDADAPPDEPTKGASGLYTALRFYPGNTTQNPDPFIEGWEGVGTVPAYRGTSYVVLEDLQLADFGNRIPNLEFLVRAQVAADAGGIASEIVRRCGIDPNTVSTVRAHGAVRGYAIGRSSSGVGGLQPLALVYDFDVAEHAGGLRMVVRGTGPLGVILTDDLAGHTDTEERPDPIRYARRLVTSLPREAVVTFPDPERDYQPNSQRAVRAAGSADSNLDNSLPVVMDVDLGRAVADRLLWEAWNGQQTAQARTDDRWVNIQVGRNYLFRTPAGLEPLRVTRRTRGANGIMDLELRRDRTEVYIPSSTGVVAHVPPNTIKLPGPSELILLDIPLLLDADDAKAAGFYWGVVGSGDGWRGADVKRALEAMGTYTQIAPQGRELTAGDVVGTLAAPGGDIYEDPWDMVSTLTVELRHAAMILESATADEVLAGANAAFVGPQNGHGGELIGFTTATAMGAGLYELSGLLRGRRGTEFAAGSHGAGELFVLLEQGALQRSEFGLGDVGEERAYKAVSLLTSEADADAVLFTNTGVGMRPYAPVDLEITGDTGMDLDLSWTRRSRIGEGVIPPPLGEESEQYVVRIRNLAGTATVREVTVTEPIFTYTVAMQTADFGGPVSDLRWRVAQVSATYGNGIFREFFGPVP